MTTSRTDFNSTWLIEMPQNIGAVEMFDMLEYNIKDQLKSKAKVIDLKNGLKKIDGERVKYYWYEQDGNILLGAELSVRPQGLVVNALNTVDDMRKYFQDDDTDFRRYQFVLSETHDILAETRSHFNTRRMRELAGVGLDD